MHTVCELQSFRSDALDAGMSPEDIEELTDYLATHPDAGQPIVGTGGCRKFRWARKGGGKSGGYRTITFFSGSYMPVYLLTVFSKGEKASLTQGEKNTLAKLAKILVHEGRRKIVKVGRSR